MEPTMNTINLRQYDELPTVFTAVTATEPRQHLNGVGSPVELGSDIGLRILAPILGPSSILLARLLIVESGRRWHIADIAGQLGIATAYTQRCISRLARFGYLDGYENDGEITYEIVEAADLKVSQLDRLHPELAALYARHSGLIGEPG